MQYLFFFIWVIFGGGFLLGWKLLPPGTFVIVSQKVCLIWCLRRLHSSLATERAQRQCVVAFGRNRLWWLSGLYGYFWIPQPLCESIPSSYWGCLSIGWFEFLELRAFLRSNFGQLSRFVNNCSFLLALGGTQIWVLGDQNGFCRSWIRCPSLKLLCCRTCPWAFQ